MVRWISSPSEGDLALLGDDLEVAEGELVVAARDRAHAPQQRPDARRELLRGERLGEVVVGAGLQTGDHVVRVGAGRHHHDRHVARAAQVAAQLEAVDARQHDVDQHDVARLTLEEDDRRLAAVRLVDRPALVLERQLDRGADALVVLNGQNPRSHNRNDAGTRCRSLACRDRRRASQSSARRSSNTPGAATTSPSGSPSVPAKVPERAPASAAISSPAARSHGLSHCS